MVTRSCLFKTAREPGMVSKAAQSVQWPFPVTLKVDWGGDVLYVYLLDHALTPPPPSHPCCLLYTTRNTVQASG